MTARQRGAAWLLAALVVGRILDRLDLPFERHFDPVGGDSLHTDPASDAIASAMPAGLLASDSSHASRLSSPAAGVHAVRSAAPDTLPIHINRATASELQRLPGVGPVLAARIIADRTLHGVFRTPTDLRRVQGIGVKTSQRLAPRLRFD